MKNKSSITSLKEAIRLLEEEQALNGKLLLKQFNQTYESLKPLNIIKNTISEVVTSSDLMDNILNTSVGIATGYLSKKVIVAGSDNKLRKLFGSILQYGVTNLVTNNPEAVKSIGQYIYMHFFQRKERISESLEV
jgi:hypothetical protein